LRILQNGHFLTKWRFPKTYSINFTEDKTMAWRINNPMHYNVLQSKLLGFTRLQIYNSLKTQASAKNSAAAKSAPTKAKRFSEKGSVNCLAWQGPEWPSSSLIW
jgi:hypothetical protein